MPPTSDPIRFYPLFPRKKASKLEGMEEARDRLSRNPEDLDALRAVSKAFLDAGDSHGARLVLARAVESGGGAEELNLLGLASYQAGDILGALDAFGRAKDSGSKAAVLNLAVIYKRLGLTEMTAELLKTATREVDGRLLEEARAI